MFHSLSDSQLPFADAMRSDDSKFRSFTQRNELMRLPQREGVDKGIPMMSSAGRSSTMPLQSISLIIQGNDLEISSNPELIMMHITKSSDHQ
jgi:hypothetical protein